MVSSRREIGLQTVYVTRSASRSNGRLIDTPNELKLKYLSDNKFKDLRGAELVKAMQKEIKAKSKDLKGSMATQGTTPRRYVDLLGSLADLTSGSGDKGTPVVLIQNYFTNYAD